MAKQIKALKCPQCGSVKKQEHKDDRYICNHCGTEYFLDDDAINVNIRHDHSYTSHRPELSGKHKKLLLLIAGMAMVFAVLSIFLGMFSNKPGKSRSPGYASKNYRERISDFFAVNSGKDEKRPLLVFKIERTYTGSDRRKEAYFMRFYDPLKEKVLNEVPMKDWNDESHIYRYRFFSDGYLYFSPRNIPKIYRVNPQKQDIEDLTEQILEGAKAMESGIATIELVSEDYGDGFEIMSNSGKEYYYFPLSGQLYESKRDMYNDGSGTETLRPGARAIVHFAFTDESFDYRDEKTQLIKYWYKQNKGYPTDLPNSPSWDKVMVRKDLPNRAGVYIGSGAIEYEKKLFRDSRVSRFKDLTPDRLYFDAEIAYADSTNLYITGLPNANPESNPYLQKIDTETGKVLWSFTPQHAKYKISDDFFTYGNGIIFRYFNYGAPERIDYIILMDKNGKVVKAIDYDKLFR